ncbi:metal-binding protein [Jannaschia sp. EhC01]|nr:metal-binding protein [Jannaschia sp. EhC01]
MTALNRRSLLVSAASLAALAPMAGFAQGAPAIHVLRDRNCGCCSAWVDILQAYGFDVTVEDSFGTLLMRHKIDSGIPQNMISCHTGEVAGYFVEGHVPPADIRRLLAERPHAVGLAVPGMPYGSPGMGPEDAREAYDVFLIRTDGSTEVFTRYDAA